MDCSGLRVAQGGCPPSCLLVLQPLSRRHWVLVLLAWVVIPVGIKLVATTWDAVAHDGDFAYLPAKMTSARSEKLVRPGVPQSSLEEPDCLRRCTA